MRSLSVRKLLKGKLTKPNLLIFLREGDKAGWEVLPDGVVG
jgi:hypothetical protein